jgi:hypothetical protein
VTNRSPFIDNASHIESEFYGSRVDTLIDGTNVEVSSKLTMIRRPGAVVYNNQTFPTINRFFENHTSIYNSNQTIATDNIQVIADTASVIYDATGPTTKTALFTKSAGSGNAFFQSVGNSMYFSDGPDQKKYLTPSLIWAANQTFSVGAWIVDSNGNIQEVVYVATNSTTQATIATAQVTASGQIGVGLTGPNPFVPGTTVTISGLTTHPVLNGATLPNNYSGVPNSAWTATASGFAAYGPAADTGTATGFTYNASGIETSGGSPPSWSLTLGALTTDNNLVWRNMGSAKVFNWGLAMTPSFTTGPTKATMPAVVPSTRPPMPKVNYWQANISVVQWTTIIDSNHAYQVATTAGTSGAAQPSWNTAIGGTTNDGTVVWTNYGQPTSWVPSYNYVTPLVLVLDTNGNLQIASSVAAGPIKSYTVNNVGGGYVIGDQFKIIGGGGSGATGTVTGTGGGGSVTSVGLNNTGSGYITTTGVATIKVTGAGTGLTLDITAGTLTNSTTPSWSTTLGGTTPDGGYTWTCVGPGTVLESGTLQYAFSYHSFDGTVSTASYLNTTVVNGVLGAQGSFALQVSGPGTADPQCDEIWIWRTVGGGTSLFLLAIIQNPTIGSATSWSFIDTLSDTGLNNLISAPIALSANVPPPGIGVMTYHLNRIWAAVGTSVYFSQGPLSGISSGNGNAAWSPSNVFTFPESVTQLFASTNGLLVFTVQGVFLIQGLGTSNSPFFATPFLPGIGLQSPDAFDNNGQILYLYTTENSLISLDPSSGVSNIGFAIGNQLGPTNGTTTFTPSSVNLTWYTGGTEDTALYMSDSSSNWWRMCPTPSPETGLTWSPMATIVGGVSAVQGVETTPGSHSLLIGPHTSGPILKRSFTTFSDNGSAYAANFTLGSLVLAQPGQISDVRFITTDSVLIGTALTMAVQLDEIAPYSSGYFEALTSYVADPAELSPSNSVYQQRFYLSQTLQPAWCRHMQVRVDFGSTDTVRNELLSMGIYAGFEQEL